MRFTHRQLISLVCTVCRRSLPQASAAACHRRWPGFVLMVIACVLFKISNVHGQSAEFTQGNKTSNAVSLEVSLGNYPGRGISLPINLHYSTQGLWRIGFMNSVYANTYVGQVRQSVTEAIYDEYSTAGWTTSLDVPKVEWPKLNDRYYANGKPYANGYVGGYTFRIARVFIHMPDGSSHELRKADAVYPDNNYIDMSGTFYAVDGSRIRYDSTGETTGTLYLSDGTRYILNGSTTQYIDRNGNTLSYDTNSRQWTDTMNRTVGMPWPVNPGAGDYTYSLPGFGASSITYTLKFRNLSDVFLADVSGQVLRPIADRYLPNPSALPTNWNGGNFPQGPGTSYLFASAYTDPDETEQSYVHVVGRGQSGFTNFNPVALAEIDLPNGQNYRFFYNAYGELDKVIYPTGGYQRYQYGQVGTIGVTGVPYSQATRGMLSRWISPSGNGSDEAQWTYSAGTYPRVVTAPDATGAPNGVRSETYLYVPSSYYDNNFDYQEALLGMPVEERIYAPASQGGAMLRRTLTQYGQTSAIINKPVPQYFPGTYTAYRNPRPEKTVTLMLDTGGNALVDRSETTYDSTYQFTVGLDATSTSEYAYTTVDQTTAQSGTISSIPTGPLVRKTQTAYLTSDPNYRNRNIVGVPTSSTIYDGANGIVSQSTISYDENNFPLLPYGTVTGWIDPQTTYRANPTTTSRWLNYPTSTWISKHAQYDQCGSLRKTFDARDTALQNPTLIEYSSAYQYAYPTQTTSSVPDSSGTHGSTTPLAVTNLYDLNTGLVTSTTDANHNTINFEYKDPLNRPTKLIRPDGGWTTTDYGDAPGNIFVHTQMLQRSTPSQQVIDNYAYFDNLGRSDRSFVYDGTGATPWVVTDTYYDSLGRVSKVSNPYRVSGISALVPATCSTCTTTEYDTLDRAFRVTTPDGAQTNTAYSASTTGIYLGTTVTVTDQTGKTRKSIMDAQGRLIQVTEDPGGVGWETYYSYDAMNNLRKVDQGGQLRYFGYDSLSRLIRVRQVEQSVNSALNWTDPVTGYASGWTMGFSYDANGNLTSRADARNITTSFAYDALNRAYSRTYSDGTPTVTLSYDSAANGLGRLASVSSSVSTVTFGGYDSMGRVTSSSVTIGAKSYSTSYGYDLTGHVKALTYPSGHIVNYDFDVAGRLNNFTGNLGDGWSRTYSTGVSYNEFGGMQEEQFGTATPLYHKQRYNVRGQLWDMRLSTVAFSTDPANGDRGAIVNYYSNNFVQGGSNSTNNGNLLRQENYIPGSNFFQDNFDYDSINRLNSINEKLNGTGVDTFKQAYTYDRWGNRTIDQGNTSPGLPLSMRSAFTANTATNQLNAPAGYSFGYDAAGNQNSDNYGDGSGSNYSRAYDADNHMINSTATYSSPNQVVASNYSYDALGRRIKRNIGGTETWQVYSLDGQLLAEYPANGETTAPTKEYGYRNGQLLITADPGSTINGYGYRRTITIDHTKVPNTDQNNFPILISGTYSYLATTTNGGNVQNANGYDVIFTSDVGCGTKLDHEVQSYTATTGAVNYWVRMPSLSHATDTTIYLCYGNSSITTDQSNKTGVWDSNFKAVYHLEDQAASTTVSDSSANGTNGTNAANTSSKNVTGKLGRALTYNGTTDNTATGVSQTSSFTWECWFYLTAWTTQSGSSDYSTLMAGTYASGGALLMLWQDSGYMVQFAPDNAGGITSGNSSVAPGAWHHAAYTRTGNSGTYSLYFDGVLKGQVAGGALSPSTTVTLGRRADATAQALNGLLDETRISNVARSADWIKTEYNNQNSPSSFYSVSTATSSQSGKVQWLVTDHLGTPRMVIDESGTLANVRRHDYLPFGEELLAGIGGRTTGQGYSTSDGVRQHFTGYELDAESGLNFAQARYQSTVQGRFTSVDPLGASATIPNPQSLNRYSYVDNSPVNWTDPSGLMARLPDASTGWSDVADGFWGSSFDFNRTHFGGPAVIFAAHFVQDLAIHHGIAEKREADRRYKARRKAIQRHWLAMALNPSVSVTATLSLAGVENWSAGWAYYASNGTSFGATGQTVNTGNPICFTCMYFTNAPAGHSVVQGSWGLFAFGTAHDDESGNEYALVGLTVGFPRGSFNFTQHSGAIRPGLYATGTIGFGIPNFSFGGNVLHMRSTFFADPSIGTPTIGGSLYLTIPQNKNLGVSYPHTMEGVMNMRFCPGPGGRPAP